MIRILFLSALLLLAACSEPSRSSSDNAWTPPAAGTVVVADSMTIREDALNGGQFSVRLTVAEGNTGKATDGFKYDVHARYGQASAKGVIIMPYGGENLKPLLRKGDGYTFIMGFIPGRAYGSDTAFHEYYSIGVVNNYIRFVALKGFTINKK